HPLEHLLRVQPRLVPARAAHGVAVVAAVPDVTGDADLGVFELDAGRAPVLRALDADLLARRGGVGAEQERTGEQRGDQPGDQRFHLPHPSLPWAICLMRHTPSSSLRASTLWR